MRHASIILDPAQRSRDLRNEVRERVAERAAAALGRAEEVEAARSSGANRRLTAKLYGWSRATADFWLNRGSA